MSTAVTIIGNITRDPEIHFAESGKSVVSFSLAVNKGHRGENGEWVQDEPEFYDCVTFKEQAENFATSFVKGQRIIAIGRLQNRSWVDKETGKERRKVELVVDEIGASVKWATVQVAKNERNDNFGGNQYTKGDVNKRTPNRSGEYRASAPRTFDEEPF